MASIEIKTRVTYNELLKGVEQLELSELETFIQNILRLRANRIAPSLPEKESELLAIINQTIPSKLQQQFEVLDEKRQSETLTEKEHQKLLKILEKKENLNVERIIALGELANIRKMPLRKLMRQLGIKMPSENE